MPAHAPTSPQQWSETLRGHGLRSTAGRLATLSFLESHPHSTVAAIHAALAEQHPSLSQQSVHNITHDLTECGVLRRIELPDASGALYELSHGDNHHHAQCVVCHRIEDIECVIGAAPCLTPEHAHGMRLLEATVVFRGVCASCDDTRRAA